MSRIRPAVPTVLPAQRVLCPYCGEVSADPRRCDGCRGFFDPLSRQATQNAMGPWFIRDETGPWKPGCSIETLREMIRRGKVTRETVLRGPGTKQFWNFAGRTPSIANLLGACHNCRAAVKPDDYSCKACGAVFTPDADRQHMGLAPVHMLPGEASPEMVAAASMDTPAPVPVSAPASEPQRPAPALKSEIERSSSAASWLVGITVVLLVAMGVVFTLVASGRLSIPGLNQAPVTLPAATPPAPTGPVADMPLVSPPSAPAEVVKAPELATPAGPAPAAMPDPLPPETTKDSGDAFDLQPVLLPLLKAEPFDEAAALERVESLRKEHPKLAGALNDWATAFKTRAEQIRRRKIP
jgi:predicted RNA-binding Zn-ribbon protein involved in translation (DUF1610 family)